MSITRRVALAGLAATPLACGRRDEAALRLWAMGNEAANVPKLLTGFDINIQALPWTAAHEKLLTAYAGGSLPDVSQIGNTWLAELVAIGALAPLPVAEEGLLAEAFPAVVETNRIGGRLYGVPWYVDTRLQFWRRDIFARAGFDAPPADWAGWKAALHRVKRVAGDGNFAILLPVNEFEQLLTFALQTGEPLLRDNGARGNFSSAGFRAALAFYKSLFDEGLAPLASNTQISNVWTEFERGFFSVYLSGPWTVGDMKTRLPASFLPRWATATMPGPDGPGASAPGGSSLVVFGGARDPDAAWRLVRHLVRPATQVAFHAATGNLPSLRSAWAPAGLATDALLRPFADQLARARPVPKVPEWERVVGEMQIVAERMVRGEYTVAAAAREIDRRADRLLEKRRWMLERGRAA